MSRTTPTTRSSDAKKRVDGVRRKYKTNTKSKKKLLPGEIPHVKDMVVILKLGGYSRVQISQVIGISRGQVAEFLEEPEVAEKLLTMREKLAGAATELLQGYMIEAVQAIVNVMRTEEDGAVILKAAAEVLDRGGMPKASRREQIEEHNESHTHEFGGEFVELLRNASPEVQEKAAQMMESLEDLLKTSAAKEPHNDAV